ncbi:HAMP domain-containing sensor histidine kinase [Pseudanabaena sp. FACHB-2040]|uniref:sensor histidine kinase n=1 Tax=Pseudanabaena sp. FACHB-2040 TaxID=2692859 RepID=UPI001685697D|nr:HAMP domain-containing sensor histidine kinase [Pseudanabaena sp. FACHB-2040]MBD2256142.1 HAMP domain-containing histidine kinase [Pseudanabaena sp. FACHB-2040]
MAAAALVAGLTLGGLAGWWLGQRRKTADASLSSAPVATAQATSEESDTALAYQRALALAQYQAGFLASTSHELRSPINQIISLHQLILEDLCDGPEEERLFLGQAQEAITKVLKNLDLLISISKLEVGRTIPELQPFSIAAIFSKVEKWVAMQAANRGCRLKIIDPDDALYGYGDPQWLQQGLVLLVESAIAAECGQIFLEAYPADAKTLTLVLKHDGSPNTWQATSEPSAESSQPAPAEVLQGLSPAFRQRLANQILARMGGEVTLSPVSSNGSELPQENENYTCFYISLPSISLADYADSEIP